MSVSIKADALQKQLTAAVRADLGRDVKLVQAKSYARLVKGKRTLAYVTGGKRLRLDVGPNGRAGRATVTTADDIPAVVKAIVAEAADA